MSGMALVRSVDVRSIRWPVWLMLGLAVAYVVYRVSNPAFSVVSTIAGAGPFLFAAAVLFVEPFDRRFKYGAAAIALYYGLYFGDLLPPYALPNVEVPMLGDVTDGLRNLRFLLLIGGFAAIGVALGGLRSRDGWVVLATGGVLAVLASGWQLVNPVEGLPILTVLTSLAFVPLLILAKARRHRTPGRNDCVEPNVGVAPISVQARSTASLTSCRQLIRVAGDAGVDDQVDLLHLALRRQRQLRPVAACSTRLATPKKPSHRPIAFRCATSAPARASVSCSRADHVEQQVVEGERLARPSRGRCC